MAGRTKYSLENLLGDVHVDVDRWKAQPSEEVIASTVRALEEKADVRVIRARNGAEALLRLKEIIPPGSEVMNGSSTTLIEIGYEDYVKSGRSEWKDYHRVITSENDDELRDELRRKAVATEYFLSSANAISSTGEIVSCDATGSRVGAWPFAARNLIIVAGVNKIVPNVDEALRRIREYAYPLEDARSKRVYGTGSSIGKCVILAHEAKKGRVTLVLVDESLGY